jgi:hypothetical protein
MSDAALVRTFGHWMSKQSEKTMTPRSSHRLATVLALSSVVFSLTVAACGGGGPAAERPEQTHATASTTGASSQAATTEASTYQTEVFRGKEVFFPQQRRPVGIGPAAGGVVKLVLDDDGCIRFKPLPKDPGLIPIWPAEFELDVRGGEIRILNGRGRVVAKVGQEVNMMGGEAGGSSLEGYNIVDKRTKRELYERCRLRYYWFVTGNVYIPRRG